MKKVMSILIKIYRVLISISIYIKSPISVEKANEFILKKYNPKNAWNKNDKFKYKKVKYDLSLIIPVYNMEKYLKKCIESLINQKTEYSYELIFINDESTDKSMQILNEYKNKFKFIKVISQKNQGVSAARNAGINESKGKYIGFIDSDDYIENNYINVLLKEAYSDDYDMVKAGYKEFNSDDNKILKIISYQKEIINYNNRKELIKIKGHPWGCVIKREIFNNIRFPLSYWYEDMIMRMLVYPKCHKVSILNDTIYLYRINNNGLSRKIQKGKTLKCLDQYFLVRTLLEKGQELNIELDEYMYKAVLHELGPTLWLRTRRLNRKIVKNTFVLSCDLKNKYFKNKKYSLNFVQKNTNKSFEQKYFTLWNLISIYEMLNIKYM